MDTIENWFREPFDHCFTGRSFLLRRPRPRFLVQRVLGGRLLRRRPPVVLRPRPVRQASCLGFVMSAAASESVATSR